MYIPTSAHTEEWGKTIVLTKLGWTFRLERTIHEISVGVCIVEVARHSHTANRTFIAIRGSTLCICRGSPQKSHVAIGDALSLERIILILGLRQGIAQAHIESMQVGKGLGIVGRDVQFILTVLTCAVSISSLTSIIRYSILIKGGVLCWHIDIASTLLTGYAQGTTHEESIVEMPLDGKVIGDGGVFTLILLRQHRIVERIINCHTRVQSQGWIRRIALQLLDIIAIRIKWCIIGIYRSIITERAIRRVLGCVAGNLEVVLECQVLVLVRQEHATRKGIAGRTLHRTIDIVVKQISRITEHIVTALYTQAVLMTYTRMDRVFEPISINASRCIHHAGIIEIVKTLLLLDIIRCRIKTC